MLFALLMEFKGLLATSTMAVLTIHKADVIYGVGTGVSREIPDPLSWEANDIWEKLTATLTIVTRRQKVTQTLSIPAWHSDDLLMMVKAIEEEGDRDVAGTGIQCIHPYKFTHLPDKGAHGYLALACGLH
ncbi:hypothetical protein BO85DRAFT_440505 [Aspergillus piperis CBS 112811]|uniref:Uncharacterized protein n=1 Tax=Aspergillus piperis CBS 112811 TaxID=1448313 RepID=A0A8G1VJ16_9EURO|nr:hypothetical protein BO85DRAFT_440505 [Aspergillus piperis CBS 112811]RAH55129.1 hypothetical protein BO85DRAFT_440505 [Aspergillus piperis CBS 112811]